MNENFFSILIMGPTAGFCYIILWSSHLWNSPEYFIKTAQAVQKIFWVASKKIDLKKNARNVRNYKDNKKWDYKCWNKIKKTFTITLIGENQFSEKSKSDRSAKIPNMANLRNFNFRFPKLYFFNTFEDKEETYIEGM